MIISQPDLLYILLLDAVYCIPPRFLLSRGPSLSRGPTMSDDQLGLTCDQYLTPDCDVVGIGVFTPLLGIIISGANLGLFPRNLFRSSPMFPPCDGYHQSKLSKCRPHVVRHRYRPASHPTPPFFRRNSSRPARVYHNPIPNSTDFDVMSSGSSYLETHSRTDRYCPAHLLVLPFHNRRYR